MEQANTIPNDIVVHFTHINNLPGIITQGLLSDSQAREEGYINSGNSDIKARRMGIRVPLLSGGVVSDYVPFYFAPRSPMLFVQRNTIKMEEIVYLVTSVSRLCASGYSCCFTDRNAAIAGACFVDDMARLETEIRWDYMRGIYWNDTDEHPDRKARRMAEFLVLNRVDWVDFSCVVAYSSLAARKIQDTVAASVTLHIPQLSVRPEWYY